MPLSIAMALNEAFKSLAESLLIANCFAKLVVELSALNNEVVIPVSNILSNAFAPAFINSKALPPSAFKSRIF